MRWTEVLQSRQTRPRWRLSGFAAGGRALVLDDLAEVGDEPRELFGAQCARVPGSYVGHDAVGGFHLLASTTRRDDELRPPVGGFGFTFDIPEAFQVVDDDAHHLFELPRGFREVGSPDALGPQI